MALLGERHALEDRVQALRVGPHEGGQQAAPRIEAGPSHEAEIDVAVRGDPLLEHQARLRQRLQRQQLDELGDVRLALAVDVRVPGGAVEARAAALGAELALGDELLHPLGHVEALLAVCLLQMLGHVQHGVQAEQVDEAIRAGGHDSGRGDALVDRLDREPLALLLAPHLRCARVEDAVDHEAGHLRARDRLLADRLREGDRRGGRLGGGLLPLDDLDQGHHGGGVKVVKANHPVGPQRGVADLGDRQRGGVRGEDRVPRRGGVELGEHLLLDLHLLRHRLDHEVDVAKALVGGRAGDAPERLLELGLRLLGGQLAALDEFVELALGDVARLLQAGLHELLVDVLEHHGEPRRGDRLGDLTTHRPGADDCGLEHEHALALLSSDRLRQPSASARAAPLGARAGYCSEAASCRRSLGGDENALMRRPA